jgi:hypothetical protein
MKHNLKYRRIICNRLLKNNWFFEKIYNLLSYIFLLIILFTQAYSHSNKWKYFVRLCTVCCPQHKQLCKKYLNLQLRNFNANDLNNIWKKKLENICVPNRSMFSTFTYIASQPSISHSSISLALWIFSVRDQVKEQRIMLLFIFTL